MSMSVKVKICGITKENDAKLAVSLGAWAIGFILYPKSPRYVSNSRVKEILSSLDRHPYLKVGVFVNPTLEEVKRTVNETGINAVQLHGNETVEFCASVKGAIPGITVIKAIRLGEVDVKVPSIDFYLLDAQSDSEWGGTGKRIDWKAASEFKTRPFLLAGGLKPENVKDALDTVKPDGIDLSSGVEISPGVKSEEKLRSLFESLGAKS